VSLLAVTPGRQPTEERPELPEEDSETGNSGLTEAGGLWFRRGYGGAVLRTLYVPAKCTEIRQRLIRESHEPVFSGHMDSRRTTERVRRHFWWPLLAKDVAIFCEGCRSCAVNKPLTRPARGVFSPNEVPTHRWDIVSMDFLSGLTRTARGNDFLFLVADRLTKRLVLIPADKSITGAGAARLLCNGFFVSMGCRG